MTLWCAQDNVRRRMEERGDTEPGVLQNGIWSQNTPGGDGNTRGQNTPGGDGSTRRWKQLRG